MGQASSLLSTYDPALTEFALEGDSEDEIALIVRLSDPITSPEGVKVVSRFGDIITLRVKRGLVAELAESATVTAVEAPRRLRTSAKLGEANLEGAIWVDAASEVISDSSDMTSEFTFYMRRPMGVIGTGKGVVVGVLDWGCDFAHPAFRNEDGSTRLLSLWDQRTNDHLSTENRWGYGRIFSTEDINRALEEVDPYSALDYHPSDSGGRMGAHGTHVLDIAAGNGGGGGIVGVAPEADLVFVHLSRTTEVLGRGNLGDSATVLEALDFVFSVAGDRPCVINMSVGAHGGPHDGSTLLEQGIDRALSLESGRAIVNSAGNYFGKRAHTQGRLKTGEEKRLRFSVPPDDPTDSEVEVWYPGVDRFTARIIDPSGAELATVQAGEDSPLVVGERIIGHIYHYNHQKTNGDHHIDIFFRPKAPEGTWELLMKADAVQDGYYHAWIERDRGLQPTFVQEDIGRNSTTGTMCNGKLSITVGAYEPHRGQLSLGSFSSAGPTRDGRVKPEIVAPGVRIRAARSTPPGELPGPRYISKSGTSMAAPHVTGAVAVMFETAGNPLAIADTRALLFSSTDRTPIENGALKAEDLHRVGFGYLDIVAAEMSAYQWAMPAANDEENKTDLLGNNLIDLEDDQTDAIWTEEGSEGSFEMPDPATLREKISRILTQTHDIRNPVVLRELALSATSMNAEAELVPVGESLNSLNEQIVQPGDLLVRSAPSEGLFHSSVVISETAENAVDLLSRGVSVEQAGPGAYVEVLEIPFGGGPVRSVGRRLTDSWGRMLHGQTLLRATDPSTLTLGSILRQPAEFGSGHRTAFRLPGDVPDMTSIDVENITYRTPRLVMDWKELIRFKPPKYIEDDIRRRSPLRKWLIQTIESAHSDDINLDYYPVYVSKMPTINGKQLVATDLLFKVRTEINNFVDTNLTDFSPATKEDATRWLSRDPRGAVLYLNIWGPDNAYVVCSDAKLEYWRFSTVKSLSLRFMPTISVVPPIDIDEHPVSGTREFGFSGTGQRAVFYTKGADRGSWRIESVNRKAFAEGHKLWKSFQRKLVEFVNKHNGRAELFMVGDRGEPFVSMRRNWKTVDRQVRAME